MKSSSLSSKKRAEVLELTQNIIERIGADIEVTIPVELLQNLLTIIHQNDATTEGIIRDLHERNLELEIKCDNLEDKVDRMEPFVGAYNKQVKYTQKILEELKEKNEEISKVKGVNEYQDSEIYQLLKKIEDLDKK